MRAVRSVVAVVMTGSAVGACALWGADSPDRSCENDLQCFRAQGEICDRARNVCIPAPDAPPPRPDAMDVPDAMEADAMDDAMEADANDTDATVDAEMMAAGGAS